MITTCTKCGKKGDMTQCKKHKDEWWVPKGWSVVEVKLKGGTSCHNYCPTCYDKVKK